MREPAASGVVMEDAGFWRLSWLVAMRHWAIYRKDFWANMLPTIVDPVLFIMVFGYWLGAHISNLGGMPYLQYMAPGLAVTTALFTAFFESSYGFYVRMTFENIFKALLTTPVGPNEILAGEFIWVALKGTAMASGVSLVLLAFQIVSPQWIWLVPLLGALVGLSCGAIGLIATAMVSNINQFQTVYALLISPMFFISGVFYPVERCPASCSSSHGFRRCGTV
jgi:lipooligosaccharide transport system permease protein